MKKYKVLTNLFKGFNVGDILIKTPGFPDCYWKINAKITDNHLPAKFVEDYPEYFKKTSEDDRGNLTQRQLFEKIINATDKILQQYESDEIKELKMETGTFFETNESYFTIKVR